MYEALTSCSFPKIGFTSGGRMRLMIHKTKPIRIIPPTNPMTGEVSIGRITFGYRPSTTIFPVFGSSLDSDHFKTPHWLRPQARAAPTSPPISEWLELDGSPRYHVS